MRILILNCFSRNSLAVINSLDPSYSLVGGAPKGAKGGKYLSSRWFHSPKLDFIFRYGDPAKDPAGFKKDIISACQRYSAQAVFPTGTTVTDVLSQNKAELERETGAVFLVEDYDRLVRLTDKWRSYHLMRELGVPVPRTALASNLEEVEKLRFPLVAKPRRSFAAKGVTFLDTKEDLQGFISETNQRWQGARQDHPFIIQERHLGELRDVTAFAYQGEARAILSQNRLMTLYDFGGGGIINQTTNEPEIIEYARKILRGISWTGAMLLDFVRDEGGRYFILECNPKIWGTTELTVKAGQNICQMMVDAFVLQKKPAAALDYKIGMVYKYVVPECIYAWTQRPRTPRAIWRRLVTTFRGYSPGPVTTNLRAENFRHLVGIVLDRSGG